MYSCLVATSLAVTTSAVDSFETCLRKNLLVSSGTKASFDRWNYFSSLSAAISNCGVCSNDVNCQAQLGEISQWYQHANSAFSTNVISHTTCTVVSFFGHGVELHCSTKDISVSVYLFRHHVVVTVPQSSVVFSLCGDCCARVLCIFMLLFTHVCWKLFLCEKWLVVWM